MIVVVVLVLFCYFGGKYCPSVLKKNKEILLGAAGGLVLCSFFGLRLEGWGTAQQPWGDLEFLSRCSGGSWPTQALCEANNQTWTTDIDQCVKKGNPAWPSAGAPTQAEQTRRQFCTTQKMQAASERDGGT